MGLTTDLLEQCNTQARASFARVFLISACNIDSMTASSTNQSFTAITTVATSDVFYEYQLEGQTKVLTGESENENGTATFTYTFEGMVKGVNKTNLKRLQDLADERKLVAVLETANSTGTYKQAFVVGWDSIIGRDAHCKVTIPSIIEATLSGDNSATLTLVADHAELMRELVGSIETNTSGTVSFGS